MDTTEEPVSLGSVWASNDEEEVVVVVGMNEDDLAVIADGWVSYGTRGTTTHSDISNFRRDFPKFIFRAKDQTS